MSIGRRVPFSFTWNPKLWEIHLTPIPRPLVSHSQFLPAYSPDFNPIEKMWSKIKRLLRSAEARDPEALEEAIGSALAKVTPKDARGWFASCGYSIYLKCSRIGKGRRASISVMQAWTTRSLRFQVAPASVHPGRCL